MRIQPRPFRCGACGHEWVGELVTDCPFDVAIAAMNAVRCPACGKGPRKIFIVTTPATSNDDREPVP
jgi:DNA-directed RNA polymerase subunit RPC12/RpoP